QIALCLMGIPSGVDVRWGTDLGTTGEPDEGLSKHLLSEILSAAPESLRQRAIAFVTICRMHNAVYYNQRQISLAPYNGSINLLTSAIRNDAGSRKTFHA